MKVVNNLNVSIIKMHPRNQEYFDDIEGEAYERFKNSIKNDGILTPLLVAPDMTLISGHQRLKAAKELGIDTVPVIVEEELKSESEIFRKLLAANFGRFKNNPIKQAKFIEEYEKQCGIRQGSAGNAHPNNSDGKTQKDIAKEFGLSQDQITNYKKLLDLIPEFQDMVGTGSDKLSATTAYKVYAKLSPGEQKKLLLDLGVEKISKMTKSQAEKEVEKLTEENEELKVNERKWYEENQKKGEEISKLKKQKQEIKEVEKIIEKIVEKPVEKIVEKKVEVVPEDYEQLKHDYQEIKRNYDLIQYAEEFQKPEKQYDLSITHFRGLLSVFGKQLGDYTYSDTYFDQVTATEKEQFLSEIDDFKLYVEMLEKNIKNSKEVV